MNWQERDRRLREAMFARLLSLQRRFGDALPWDALAAGFPFEGGIQPLASKAEGIYTPAGHPAALSIKTTVPRNGRENPYDDHLAEDGGALRYAYKARGGPGCAANRALRTTCSLQIPLVYLWGLAPGVYAAIFPVFITADLHRERTFLVSLGARALAEEGPLLVAEALADEPVKAYAPAVVRRRLHQPRFRYQVLAAYEQRCAICRMPFPELLQAAHILPDADPRSQPVTSNGLALCTLHHEAYDRGLLEIDERYTIQLDPAVQKRRDGPVFREAFLERHGQPILLPRRQRDWPDPEMIQLRREEWCR